MKVNEIEKAALHLSLKERANLSYKLLESIDSENIDNIDEIWQNEVDERYKHIKSGNAKTKNAELVIKEAKAKYRIK